LLARTPSLVLVVGWPCKDYEDVRFKELLQKPLMHRFEPFRRVVDHGLSDEGDVRLAQLSQSIEVVLGTDVSHICLKDIPRLKTPEFTLLGPRIEIKSWDKMVKFLSYGSHAQSLQTSGLS
jgi:hypothetical protein